MQKNNLIVNTILEIHFKFNILFIQEPSWLTIHSIPSSKSRDSKELVRVPNHFNWLVFTNKSSNICDCSRVITYVNIRLSPLQFSLCKDILSHRDISIVSLFINNNIFFLINIYSDSLQLALKYLKDTRVDIPNTLAIAGDFNIRDSFWDLLFSYHSLQSDLLIDITDFLSLGLLYPTNAVPTRYLDNDQSLNSVINLTFLRYSLVKLDNHTIHLEWRLLSDHTSLTVIILIEEQLSNDQKYSIAKSSEEEMSFMKDLIKNISSINTSNLSNIKSLENAIDLLTCIVERAWDKNSKIVNISKHLKNWWDMSCSRDLEKYRSSRSLANWKQFKKTVKNTKHSFFDQKIQEILNKTRGLWELINWVRKRNLPTVKAIKYNDCPCLEINDLWHTLHSTFNMAQDYYINIEILEEISDKTLEEWSSFSREEFMKAIAKCNNLSVPRPDKLSWGYQKCIIKNEVCLGKIISIANACFELGFWPLHFKSSMTIIIPIH